MTTTACPGDAGHGAAAGRSGRARSSAASGFAALVLALAGHSHLACAEEVGKLFFTPQQRQELDRKRLANVVEQETIVVSLVTMNGHVTRSSGKTTTWVNGTPQYDMFRPRDPRQFNISEDAGAPAIKVGQTLDKNSGEVRDSLSGGEIKVNRSK